MKVISLVLLLVFSVGFSAGNSNFSVSDGISDGLEGGGHYESFVPKYNALATQILECIFKHKSGNFFISPFSASITFGLLRDGAKGETANEITAKFGFPAGQSARGTTLNFGLPLHKYVRGFRAGYVSKDFQLDDQFKEIGAKYYLTQVENIDLSDTDAATLKIGYEMAAQSNDVIQNAIKPSDLDSSGKLYAITAESFQGRFILQRPPSVSETDFRPDSKTTHKIVFANFRGWFNYLEDSALNVKVLEIPLEGPSIYFRIVLPAKADGIQDLEKLTAQLLNISPDVLRKEQVSASIPKFVLSSVWHEDCLTESLPSVFSGKADFSGIAGKPGDIFLNSITAKAYIRFNEYGLEIPEDPFEDSKIQSGAQSESNPSVKEFTADHPFFFFIRQGPLLHFVGRVNDPTKNFDAQQ